MSSVSWDVFERLPGAAELNFERLCRILVRRHYGQYGDFRELANQAGVEFHLRLKRACDLGAPPRWFGWQCKWFQVKNGQPLGAARRKNIVEGLSKTKKYLPELTDWVLWTRQKLTKADQEWFYGLSGSYPGITLTLMTGTDVEGLLSGPGALLRETYFGELIVTPEILIQQHQVAMAPIRHRFQPEVHQIVPVEQNLRMDLAQQDAWDFLSLLADSLRKGVKAVDNIAGCMNSTSAEQVRGLIDHGLIAANLADDFYTMLGRADLDAIRGLLAAPCDSPRRHQRLLAQMRKLRSESVLFATNLIADIYVAKRVREELSKSINARSVAVLGVAGGGKSELAVRLTQPSMNEIGGVLLLGKDLHAGQSLDDLAGSFKILGKATQTFEQLAEALDAAGQRAGRRIPIVVDGLNESEDPKAWKNILARADEVLKRMPYVMLIVTLRNAFAGDCLPQDIPQQELSGFEQDPKRAIDAYFSHYRIDAAQADLPIEILQHPLTLRIFCEVANPRRDRVVGVDALPRSMTAVFEAYFDMVAERIAELSTPTTRIYQDEVRASLMSFADSLWKSNSRSLERNLAHHAIGHTGTWHTSMLRSLESEGVLVRTAERLGIDGFAFAYDLLAGHMLARNLLQDPNIVQWLNSDAGLEKLAGEYTLRHPLAGDVLTALSGLFPRFSVPRRQLWQVVPNRLRNSALLLAIRCDPPDIGRETVDALESEIVFDRNFAARAYIELQLTRGMNVHPLDSRFLENVLLKMSNTDRDLSWSVWILDNERSIVQDISNLESRWESGRIDAHEVGRARWVKWVLTTNSRHLRDIATRALYKLALRLPGTVFPLAVESLRVPDPYVPERMLAATYGAALSGWADLGNKPLREALVTVVPELVQIMFKPGAEVPTRHTLLRQYCLGLIDLARRIDPDVISVEDLAYLRPPFDHLPCPFKELPAINDELIEAADHQAIGMDFGNYTFGRLIPGRSNYDFEHSDYAMTRKAIVTRMIELGYDPIRFQDFERKSTSYSRADREGRKVDRFGKKYGWIAYMEMWGWREDNGTIPKYRSGERTSDAGIDPSFPPSKISAWSPSLSDIFALGQVEPVKWILEGPTPDYAALLTRSTVDSVEGNWVLLTGFIQETASQDYRDVSSDLRGLFVRKSDITQLEKIFLKPDRLGGASVPPVPEHYYKFAGEMPFAIPPGFLLNATSTSFDEDIYDELPLHGRAASAVTVKQPAHSYNWESYHSELNPESGVYFPAPTLCEKLELRYENSWDLVDDKGVASLFRTLSADDISLRGQLLYLREDLIQRYLDSTDQALVWLIWGERGLNYRAKYTGAELHGRWDEFKHVHKRMIVWEPGMLKSIKPAKTTRIRRKVGSDSSRL